jgi:hypothetical protein
MTGPSDEKAWHPDAIPVPWTLLIRTLPVLEAVGKHQLVSWSEEEPPEYDGDAVEAAALAGVALLEAAKPGFDVGDEVTCRSRPGQVGQVRDMILFDTGWYVTVEYSNGPWYTSGADCERAGGPA